MGGSDGRRRLLWLTAAVAVLLLVVLGGPFGRDEPPEAASDTHSPADRPTLTGPTRGSLAGDTAFVDAVRRLPWTHAAAEGPRMPEPPQESRWVAFAGDVGGGRWALVLSTAPAFQPGPEFVFARWFGGPRGAGPDELTTTTPPIGVPDGDPLGLLDHATGILLVVAAPGDAVEVSDLPEIGPDGEPVRTYHAVPTRDGIAVVPLDPRRTSGLAAAFRTVRDGRTQEPITPWVVGQEDAAPPPVDHPRGPPSTTATLAVDWTAEALLGRLGLPVGSTEVTALWTGNVPGPGPEAGQAVLVAVTVPSGAVLVDGEWLLQVESPSGDYVQGGDCGLGLLPAGPPAEERVYALACEVVDPRGRTPLRSYLVVVAPPEVALVRVHDDDSRWLAEFRTSDGVVVAPLPRGTATVEAVTAGDISLGRTALLGRGIDLSG